MTQDNLLRRAVTAALVAGTMAWPLGAAVDPAAERIAGSSSAEIRAELVASADPEMRFSNGLTPLHYAARVGHLEVIRILVLEAGVDPNILSARNFVTPLHSASLRFDRKSASASETASFNGEVTPEVQRRLPADPVALPPALGQAAGETGLPARCRARPGPADGHAPGLPENRSRRKAFI